jgi:hypothetical protein
MLAQAQRDSCDGSHEVAPAGNFQRCKSIGLPCTSLVHCYDVNTVSLMHHRRSRRGSVLTLHFPEHAAWPTDSSRLKNGLAG